MGMETAARANPDGYTIVQGSIGPVAIDVSIHSKLPYHPIKDYTPIARGVSALNMLVVHPSLPVQSVKDLVAYARANPTKLNFGSSGVAHADHMAGELFKTMTGVDITHIPYKGAGPMMQDLLAGQVDMAFDGMSTSAPQIRAGKLKALAVTTTERSFVAPNVPTMQEAGLAGYVVTTWYALWAPRGAPKEALERMHRETVKAMQSPELKQVWESQGATAGGESPEEFAKLVKSEIGKWAKVVKDSGAKVDN